MRKKFPSLPMIHKKLNTSIMQATHITQTETVSQTDYHGRRVNFVQYRVKCNTTDSVECHRKHCQIHLYIRKRCTYTAYKLSSMLYVCRGLQSTPRIRHRDEWTCISKVIGLGHSGGICTAVSRPIRTLYWTLYSIVSLYDCALVTF